MTIARCVLSAAKPFQCLVTPKSWARMKKPERLITAPAVLFGSKYFLFDFRAVFQCLTEPREKYDRHNDECHIYEILEVETCFYSLNGANAYFCYCRRIADALTLF